MTDAATITIRPFKESDVAALHAINEAAIPGVNSLSEAELLKLLDASAATLVAVEGHDDAAGPPSQVLGFVLCLIEGLAYDSLNYAWLSERYPQFSYVDRVAVSPNARGKGVGRALYEALFPALSPRRDQLLCEVNLAPPNPQSQAFHKALGFEPVGERWTDDRAKGVVYLRRPLP